MPASVNPLALSVCQPALGSSPSTWVCSDLSLPWHRQLVTTVTAEFMFIMFCEELSMDQIDAIHRLRERTDVVPGGSINVLDEVKEAPLYL